MPWLVCYSKYMPTKKKTTKKPRAKKLVNKKSPVKAVAAKPAKPAATTAAAKPVFRWDIWVLVLVLLIPLIIVFLYLANRTSDTLTPSESSGSLNSGSSQLRVVPGEETGTSSNQASGALQPQAAGLQQAQPTSQSAGGLNLQAQTSPRQ